MIDLHSHILPGIDDGARTVQESREIARSALADGITAIAATPHVRDDYPTGVEQMEQGVEMLRDDFARTGIPIEVLAGGEIALDRLPALRPDEIARFSLAQTGRYLLLEFPYYDWPLSLERTVSELERSGVTALLAHPERNRDVKRQPARLGRAVGAGALVQLTAASLDGRLGQSTKQAAERLLELGFGHVIASDAHSPELREVGLASAAAAVGDAGLARYLTEEVPAAIAAGETVPPPRPLPRRRRRFRLF